MLGRSLCIIVRHYFILPGSDFTTPVITVRIPAAEEDSGAISTFQLPAVFAVVDDDVNENSESFALVAEIGDDVPKHFACFQKMIGNTECYARTGAAEISIADNDGKFLTATYYNYSGIMNIFCSFSHGNWIFSEESDYI